MTGEPRSSPERTEALERTTGMPWSEWVALFEAAGAASLNHAEIARIALAAMPSHVSNPGWWAQGAAIAYEHQIGMRAPGQSATGSWRVGANRTVSLGRDAAIERWDALFGAAVCPSHRGHALAGEVRRSRTEKRTFWRVSLEGAGKLEVAASEAPARAGDAGGARGPGEDRASVALQHTALASGDELEEWRAHWKAVLAEL